MEILARGGGILSSVRAVRDCKNLGVRFADRFFEYGTTTIEAKSGYGLTRHEELRMLEAMQQEQRLEVIPTYLGAHALPRTRLPSAQNRLDTAPTGHKGVCPTGRIM